MQRRYVETSALLRALLEGDPSLRSLFADGGLFASSLTFLEASRAITRARREGRLNAQGAREAERHLASVERGCSVAGMGDEVLRRARLDLPLEPVRSLDAIHLATLRLLDEELGGFELVSTDERVRRNALALGFKVLPATVG